MDKIIRYFQFSGRATRAEYWLVTLIISGIVLIPAYISNDPYSLQSKNYVTISSIVTLWPILAVQVRRWHDRNKAGWWVLINFVPIIGFVWAIIENGFLSGIDKDNEYNS